LLEESFRVPLGNAALILSRGVPDECSLRLNNAEGCVVTERKGQRSGEGDAGYACRASENSHFHGEKNFVANAAVERKLLLRWQEI
jgi:hypothetical protein